MIKSKLKLKTISLFLAAFSFWGAILQPDTAMALQSNIATAFEVLPKDKIIFPEFARVEWSQASESLSKKGMIYLFQDAHTSLLAQQRITQTLLQLRKQKALDGLLVEGAAGNLTTERFDANPDFKTNPELIEKLQRQGYLHGAAAYYLAKPETPSRGMESPALYRKNAELFRRVFGYQKRIQPLVSMIQVEWQRWLKTHVAGEYRDFFLNSALKHTDSADPDFFKQLLQTASDCLRMNWEILDQIEWPNLIRVQRLIQIQSGFRMDEAHLAFKHLKKDLSGKWEERLKRIELSMKAEPSVTNQATARSYRDFAADLMMDLSCRNKPVLGYRAFFDWLAAETFRNEIQPEGLIDEIEKLENQVWGTWFKKADEQSWMKLGRLAALLDKATRLELSRREVRQFRAAVRSGEFQKWIARFAPEKKDLFARFCVRVIQFYAAAEKREAGFSKNILEMLGAFSKVKTGNFPKIAVVLGGYHKEGLLEALKSKDLEVAVITPHLERIDHDVAYRERMLEPAVEASTLSMVPSAAVSRAELRELVGALMAELIERDLAAVLSRSETRDRDDVVKVIPEPSRRRFLIGAAAFLSFPVISAAQDALDKLLNQAAQPAPAPVKTEFVSAVFPIESLQLSKAEGMDGYLSGLMGRIDQNLPGLKEKWTRVLAETELMRVNRLSLMPTFSQSKGGLGMGVQIAGSNGDRLEISDGGMTMAMKTIGLLLDEILVNPVQNRSDEAAILAAGHTHQWRRLQLAGEVAKLLQRLRAAETKDKILTTYINRLAQTEKQVQGLAENKTVTDEQVNTISSFLNEAMDIRGRFQIEMAQVREGLKMILGVDFDFKTVKAPVPVRTWLDAPASKKDALIAGAQSKVGKTWVAQASQAQADAYAQGAKAEKRRGFFSWFIRRGPAKPDKTRQELGLGTEKLSSNPAAARLQVQTEAEKIQTQILQQELRGLVAVEATRFFTSRDSHARWQQQVYQEQIAWRARGLLAEDYDLDRLSLLKRFVDAQMRVIDARTEMSGAAIAWSSASLEDQSASSTNWLSPVLLSGYFPAGFEPSKLSAPVKRSESRLLRNLMKSLLIVILFLGSKISALAQQPQGQSGGAGTAAVFVADQAKLIWEQAGKLDMSSAAGDKPALLGLRIPEIVILSQDGSLRLNDSAQLQFENLKSEFEKDLQVYMTLKNSGAKHLSLRAAFEALVEKGIELDRFERIIAALKLAQSPDFKVIRSQAGTYGENQTILEVVSKRVAKVQVHIPLKHLLGTKIHLEIAGQKAVLLSRPRVLEVDTRGEAGDVLVELTASVEQPIDFSKETNFRVRLKKTSQPAAVSNHEPAEVLFQGESGAEISLGVLQFLRDELPVPAPSFGMADLSGDTSAGEAKTGSKIAQIKFIRSGLEAFLLRESALLAGSAKSALEALDGVNGFTAQELEQLRRDATLEKVIRTRLDMDRDLTSPADGSLEVSSDLAAGFPLNAGQSAAWVRTKRVLIKGSLTGHAAQLSEGDAVTVRLADGRKVTGKIQTVITDNRANVFGRKSFVAEFDIPVSEDELDMSALSQATGFSPAMLFTMLASAHQGGGNGMSGGIIASGELAGPIGGVASGVAERGSQPARVPGLAELIANDADSLNAMNLFKRHRGEFGAQDYQVLLSSEHLSLTYETAKLLLLDRSDWADVIIALSLAADEGDLTRVRAFYDAVTAALVSGGKEIEAGLRRLGTQVDIDPLLRQKAESLFATLMADRGLNDDAARRLLDSEFWNDPELAQFLAELSASPNPEIKNMAQGIAGLIWRISSGQQIASIQNSAFADKTMESTPDNILMSRSMQGRIDEFVYRNALLGDLRLLRHGLLDSNDPVLPSIAKLIDPGTASKVKLSPKASSRPVSLVPGILGKMPVTLGELDVLSVPEQEKALNDAAARGDLELLTWVFSSQASEHLRKVAVTTLLKSNQGSLLFARWFAGHQNVGRVTATLKIYGFARFFSDLKTRVESLESEQQDDDFLARSLAPQRQILFDALFRLILQETHPLTAEDQTAATRLLLMLVSDPADLGGLAQGHEPGSVEADNIRKLPVSSYQNLAAEELGRRALLTAFDQFPRFSRGLKLMGENRLAETANQIKTMRDLLAVTAFSAQSPLSGNTAEMPAVIEKFIRKHVNGNDELTEAMVQLALGHFNAGWTGHVEVPSASVVRSPISWLLLIPFVSLVFFTVKYWKLARAKYLEIRIKRRWRLYRESGLSFAAAPNLDIWKKRFPERFERNFPAEMPDLEKLLALPRRAVRGNLGQLLAGWAMILEKSKLEGEDYQLLERLMRQSYNTPKMHLRPTVFTEFRHNDRLDDLSVIKAYIEIMILTLEKIRDEGGMKSQHDFALNLQAKINEITTLVRIYFALRNRRTNENYSALRRFAPELDQRANQDADEEYRLKKKIWTDIRGWMGLTKAYQLIHNELGKLYATYLKQNAYLAAAALTEKKDEDAEAVEFLGLLNAAYTAEIVKKYVDNGWMRQMDADDPHDNQMEQGGRRMHSREFNISGFVYFILKAVIPAVLAAAYLSGPYIALIVAVSFVWALYTSPVVLNYFDHLKTNLSGLRDPYSDEIHGRLNNVMTHLKDEFYSLDAISAVETDALPIVTGFPLTATTLKSGITGAAARAVDALPTKEPDASMLDEVSPGYPLRVLGLGAISGSAGATTTVLKTIILPSHQPPAPKAVPAPATSEAQPKTWAERVDAWKNNAGVAAVVVYVSEADQEAERTYLDQLFNQKYRFSNYRIQVVPDVSRVTVNERRELQNQILDGSAGKKVIFMRSQGIKNGQHTYGMMSEIPAEKKVPAAVQAETPAPIFNLDPVIAELNRRPAEGQVKKSGLDAVVVAVNETDDIAASKKLYGELLARYGYRIPLTVFRVPGTGSGNGLPTLAMMQGVTHGVEDMMREKGVSNPRVLVLSGFGPENDFMRRATGSPAFTPSVIRDDQGLPVPLAAIKIAQAVLAVRQLTKVQGPVIFDAETDTIHDHPFIPNLKKPAPDVSSGGDITFFTVERPIQKAAKFGVPVLAGTNAGDPHRIIGFFEKAKSGAKLAALINSFLALKGSAALNETSVVNVFTGDVAVHIQDPLKREQFNQLLSLAKNELQAQANIDTDFIWDFVAIVVRAANDQQRGKRTEIERHASLGIYSLHRAQVDSRGREVTSADYDRRKDIYSALHQKIYDAAFQIKDLNIHAETAEQAKLRDVRTVQSFSKLALKARFGEPGEYFRTIPERGVVITSLNGTFPPVREARDFYAELAHTQEGHAPVIVHGPRSETAKTPRNSLGVPRISDESLSRITDESGFPFLLNIPENQRPVYTPESHVKSDQIRDAEFLDGLYGGQNLIVQGGLQELRQRGYVSENQISLVAPESVRGINNPVYRQAPGRAELRTLVSLAKTVRTGVLAATIIIFYGILPMNALASVIERVAFYEPKMIPMLYRADLEVPTGSEALLSALSTPQVKASNTLFLEAAAIPAKDLLKGLEELSRASFKVEVLFTSGNEPAFNQAREALGGRLELRNVRIQIGANVPAMMNERIGASVRDNRDVKNQMAFAGRGSEARRARQLVSNLIALEGNNLPWSLVFEAITSPAVFNFYRNGNPHKIWSIRNVASVLLRAAQAIARAA